MSSLKHYNACHTSFDGENRVLDLNIAGKTLNGACCLCHKIV